MDQPLWGDHQFWTQQPFLYMVAVAMIFLQLFLNYYVRQRRHKNSKRVIKQFATALQAGDSATITTMVGQSHDHTIKQLGSHLLKLLQNSEPSAEQAHSYEELIRSSTYAVAQFDSTTYRCIDANPAFFKLIGYPAGELTALDGQQILPTLADAIAQHASLLQNHQCVTLQGIHCRHRNGHLLEVSVDLMLLSDTTTSCYALLIHNGHPSQEAEQLYIDIIPDSFVHMNSRGDYLRVHYGYSAPFSVPAEQMVGRNLYELAPHNTADTIMTHMREALTTKGIIQYEYERQIHGQTYFMESRIIAKNDDEIIAVIRDITERRKAEAMIRHQARLVESVSDVIISIDRNFCIASWNQAAVDTYGYQVQEVIGKPLDDYIRREYVDSTFEEVLEIILSVGTWQGETTHFARNGRIISFWGSISQLYDFQGEQIGIVAILHNISERKRAEQLLPMAQQSESLKTLAGGIAHDFNNLLTSVLSYVTLAGEQLQHETKLHSYLEKARKATERAADLTRQLLAFTGQGAYIVEPLDLNQLIRDNTGLLNAILPADAKLILLLSDLPPLVEMDRGHAQQIIMNLLINAGEALPGGSGEIEITTKISYLDSVDLTAYLSQPTLKPGYFVSLIFRDNGSGMGQSTIARIFDPYFTTKNTGSGLGLSATLGIVNRYKGGLYVISEEGNGTEFRLLFPFFDNTQATHSHSATTFSTTNVNLRSIPESKAIMLNGESLTGRILIIDDEITVRETFGEILSAVGFQIVLAADGYEGIEQYQADHTLIDLVLLDMKMPGLNGIQTFEALREIDPQVRVILCSGYSESEVVSNLPQSTLTTFLQKPVRISDLITSIKAILAN